MIKLNEIINVAEAEKFTEISFSLDERAAKPIFISLSNSSSKEFQVMLDSGASIPVWCSGKESLKKIFPKADLRDNMKYILGGFGNGFETADVYYIPTMMLFNGEHLIAFNRTYLPVVDKDRFGENLILPSSFFKNASITIAQIKSLPEKQLILQCHSLWYEMKFTKVRVNDKVAKTLKEKYHIDGISAGQDILGVEGEFNDALAQLGVSAKIMEDNPEQDSLAAPLDVFGKNFEN